MITAILQVVAERLLTAIPGGKDLPLLDSENQTRTQGFVLTALLKLSTVPASGTISSGIAFPPAAVAPDAAPGPRRTSDGNGGAFWLREFLLLRERPTMALFRVRPTRADIEIANAVSKYTDPEAERIAETLTWGADEHILCALAAGWWLYSRHRTARDRQNSDHILLTTVAVTLLPHALKAIFDQDRPDRLTVRGHLHGVPLSGKRRDAFPSGHAIHVGALASAATVLPPAKRNLVWSVGAGLVLTRIVLLAHWASDVVTGLAIGALVERLLRLWTGYGARHSSHRSERSGT
jgi:undecaprenyl-diphosphatase